MNALIKQYADMHARGCFQGFSILKHKELIGKFIAATKSKSVLDYGSGKCGGYQSLPFAKMLVPYDPALPSYREKPEGVFDGVICVDVLEHIPEDEIDGVMDELDGYGRKFVFLSICTRPAKKRLPDGRNCHLTVKPPEWWWKKIGNRRFHVEFVE